MPHHVERLEMVRTLERYGVRDQAVLDAMTVVPRHKFVPERLQAAAYDDGPLPIGEGQTISQPYMVAYMTEQLGVKRGDRVLEIGTGSGYQAAVLSQLGVEVFSLEIVPELSVRAAQALRSAGYPVDEDHPRRGRIHLAVSDGYGGWPEHGPFDAIVVTAAPDHVPTALTDQLRVGGRLVIPVGERSWQELLVIQRTPDGLAERHALPVAFVPMTGEAQKRQD